MCKVDCTAPVLNLTERRELRAVVHGKYTLEDKVKRLMREDAKAANF